MHLKQAPVFQRLKPHESTRIAGIDAARVIASLGVIWLHTGYSDYNALGYFRMPFFTALLAYLVATGLNQDHTRTILKFVRSRAFRILLPFAVWVLLFRVPHVMFGHRPVPLTINNLLMGLGAVPLWYLPFAFFASLLAFSITVAVQRVRGSYRFLTAGALLGAGIAGSYVAVAEDPKTLWAMGMPLLGSLAMGVALAFFRQSARIRSVIAREWVIWTLLWLVFTCLSMSLDPVLANFFGTFAGVFLLLAGLSVPLPNWPRFWSYLGKLSYGMFLTHWAFIILLERAGIKGEGTALPRFAFIVAASMATSAILQQTRPGRFLLGMELAAKKDRARPLSREPADESVVIMTSAPEPALVALHN